jgi:N-acetylneuraminate synthase
VRTVEAAIGSAAYGPTEADVSGLQYRRSLFVVRDLRAGDVIDADAVRSVRPALGLHTRHLRDVIGRRVRHDVAAGTPVEWDLFES